MGFIMSGIICVSVLVFLILIGLPIGVAFITGGIISCANLIGLNKSLALLREVSYHSIAGPSWVAIPLFILMGEIAAQAGFAEKAYKALHDVTKGIAGSLGVATSFACAFFGAISGSTIATTAIFGRIAYPEMIKHGYNKHFALAIVAASGTFATMIPPSIMFVVYALFTDTSVAALFLSGIIPGIITATCYSIYIIYSCKRRDKKVDTVEAEVEQKEIINVQYGDDRAYNKKILSRISPIFKEGWPIIVIATIVFVGIYSGIFTATEAAAVGSVLALVVGIATKGIKNIRVIIMSLQETANTSAMIFFINVGSLYFSKILGLTRLPTEITNMIINLKISPMVFVGLVLLLYFFLGMIMVPIGMFALTLPIVTPIMRGLGINLIWFAVLAIKLTEIGAVTPPVGLNVFALKGVVKDVSLDDIFKNIWPFVVIDLIVLVLLIVFPNLILFLPNLFLK